MKIKISDYLDKIEKMIPLMGDDPAKHRIVNLLEMIKKLQLLPELAKDDDLELDKDMENFIQIIDDFFNKKVAN